MGNLLKLFCSAALAICISQGLYAKPGKKGSVGADPVPFGAPEHTVQNKGGFTTNRIPLGILSAYGILTKGSPYCQVDKVIEGGLAAKNGLKVGDVITGINGKKLDAAFSDDETTENGPLQSLGFGMEEALTFKDRKLSFTVNRGGSAKTVSIPLPAKMKPFSETYPVNCERSEEILEALTEKLVEIKGSRMNIGGEVQSSTAGMGLMGSYNLKLTPHCRDIARWMSELPPVTGGLPAWGLNYGTTYMCEYYLATHEKFVLPAIEARLKIHEDWISPEGKVGHGKEVGYKGAGINIIGSHHFMNFGLMNRCGFKITPEPWTNVKKWITACQSGIGAVGYIGGGGWVETSGITGMSAIGFMLSEDPERAFKATTMWVSPEGERMPGLMGARNSHANSSFGMTWSSAAMSALRRSKKVVKMTSKSSSPFGSKGASAAATASSSKQTADGYRVYMDYWKWKFSLAQAPEGSNVVHYFIPSFGNCGGDGYLGYDVINHASHAMVFATAKQGLFIHGNTRENWYNKAELLKKLGLYDKVVKLQSKIDMMEKARKFREAYDFLMELKAIDPENDYIFEKPRNWMTYANTEINRVLPEVADKNYYVGVKAVKAVLKKYGSVIAPRAKFYNDLLDSSKIAKIQLDDGPKAEAVVRDVQNERITPKVGVTRLEKVIRRHKGTGFNRYYAEMIIQWRKAAEASEPVAEKVPVQPEKA